jgi:hypothetical protein
VATANGVSATVHVTVDVTPPDPVTDFVAARVDRRHIGLTWTPPPATTCTIRWSPGSVLVSGAPIIDAAGSTSPLTTSSTRLGQYTFQLKCADAAANVDTQIVTFTLDFVAGPSFPATFRQESAFASGDLDGDGNPDLAFRNSGVLDIYWGSASHTFAATPDLVVSDSMDALSFPLAAAIMDYNHDGANDLVVSSAQDLNDGAVYVLLHSHFASRPATLDVTSAVTASDTVFFVDPATTDTYWTGLGSCMYAPGDCVGSSLVPVDFDGDGIEDLAIGAMGAQSSKGGAVIVFGHPVGSVLFPTTTTFSAFRIRTGGGGKSLGKWVNLGRVGDVASDAREDLVATTPAGIGALNVYYGRAAPPTGTTDISIFSDTVQNFNANPLVAGSIEDQDANGVREVIFDGGSTTLHGIGPIGFYNATLNSNICAGDSFGGDIDGDGHDDLVCITGSNLSVYWGTIPTTVFAPNFTSALTSLAANFITWTPDLDGDGYPDIAVVRNANVDIFY